MDPKSRSSSPNAKTTFLDFIFSSTSTYAFSSFGLTYTASGFAWLLLARQHAKGDEQYGDDYGDGQYRLDCGLEQ